MDHFSLLKQTSLTLSSEIIMNSSIGIGQDQEMETPTMQSLENKPICPQRTTQSANRKRRPQPDESPKCPRCDSANTKFCYYNNYSLSQPRYFCKSCHRYWTKGGTLRNVPVRGGCQRNRRPTTSSSKIGANDHQPMSLFAPVGCDSNEVPPLSMVHKLVTGHESYYDLPYPMPSHGRDRKPSSGFHDMTKGGFGFGFGLLDNQVDFPDFQPGFGDTVAVYDDVGNANLEGEGENNRVLMGFPWQVNGDGNCVDMVDVVNTGIGNCYHGNGFGPCWYNGGSVNYPLM